MSFYLYLSTLQLSFSLYFLSVSSVHFLLFSLYSALSILRAIPMHSRILKPYLDMPNHIAILILILSQNIIKFRCRRWVDGRLNAIVFALSPMPDGTAPTQIEQATKTADVYQAKIIAYFEKEWLVTNQFLCLRTQTTT